MFGNHYSPTVLKYRESLREAYNDTSALVLVCGYSTAQRRPVANVQITIIFVYELRRVIMPRRRKLPVDH